MPAFVERLEATGGHKDPTTQLTCVRTRRHKLAAAHGRGEEELYDLEIDPKETAPVQNRFTMSDAGSTSR